MNLKLIQYLSHPLMSCPNYMLNVVQPKNLHQNGPKKSYADCTIVIQLNLFYFIQNDMNLKRNSHSSDFQYAKVKVLRNFLNCLNLKRIQTKTEQEKWQQQHIEKRNSNLLGKNRLQ